ncbi:hypothetical protein ACGFZJ_21540 [Streptomyces sp. NPDC048253]|uniref:hypothetical protein n=1 Tax=Streptomyces sp. NPDC048253 TaxID=3365524 RepID=UPI003711EE6F
MAGPSTSGGNAEHTLNLNEIPPAVRDAFQLYFRKDEAKTLVMKVTAINHTVDYLKIGLAAVATGLTLLKADFTIAKVDEKGISWLGNTLYTFPWAKEGHNWWRTIMPEKLVRKFDEKEDEKKELRNYVDRTFYKASRAEGLHTGIRRAKDAAAQAQRDVDSLRAGLRSAAAAGAPRSVTRDLSAKKDVTELRASVTSLSAALAGI